MLEMRYKIIPKHFEQDILNHLEDSITGHSDDLSAGEHRAQDIPTSPLAKPTKVTPRGDHSSRSDHTAGVAEGEGFHVMEQDVKVEALDEQGKMDHFDNQERH
jgi:hypothetical protein